MHCGAVMARKLRVQFEGAIYHVTLRGVERRRIFDDDADRKRFVLRLSEAVGEYGVRLYLFVLMRNHAHLLCETPRANLSGFMHKLQTAYSVYYNLRHRRAGHLTQGRFGDKPVAGDRYLLKLSRYIHLNPVFVRETKGQAPEAKLRHLESYRWSSYRGYAGLAKPYGFVDDGPILALTAPGARHQRRAYRRYVEEGIAETDEELMSLLKTSRWGIGDKAFQNHVRDLHAELALAAKRKEDVSFRRVERFMPATDVLAAVAEQFAIESGALRRRQYDCAARGVAALMLGLHAGMNQRDIGVLLDMGTGSAVLRQLQRLRERQSGDFRLRRQIQTIRQTLQEAAQELQMSIVKG